MSRSTAHRHGYFKVLGICDRVSSFERSLKFSRKLDNIYYIKKIGSVTLVASESQDGSLIILEVEVFLELEGDGDLLLADFLRILRPL